MTVERNGAIAMFTLYNWLKSLAPARFSTNEKQNHGNCILRMRFFPRFGNCCSFQGIRLVYCVVCSCCDWSEFDNGFSTGQQLNAKSAQRSTGNQKQDKKMHNSGRVFCNCSNANLRQNVLITCLYFFSVLNLAHIRCHLHGERKKKTNFRRNASKQII